MVEILRGIAAHIRGEPLPESTEVGETLPLEAVHRELSRYRYCTTFFVEGEGVEPDRLEADLAALGDSLLVVGGPAVKARVTPMSRGARAFGRNCSGRLGGDRHPEHACSDGGTAPAPQRGAWPLGSSCRCAGAGNRRLLESLGAACVDGGRFMNPSTAELLAAMMKPCLSARCCCCRTTVTCSPRPRRPPGPAPRKCASFRHERFKPVWPPWSHSTRAERRRRTRST